MRRHRLSAEKTDLERGLSVSLCDLSVLLRRQGRFDEAKTTALEAIEISSRIKLQEVLGDAHDKYSRVLYTEGSYEPSRVAAQKAVDICRELHSSSPEVMKHRISLADILVHFADASLRCKYQDQALIAADEAVAMYRDPAMSSRERDECLPGALGSLAEALASLGRVSEALEAVGEGIQATERVIEERRFLKGLKQDLKYLKGLRSAYRNESEMVLESD